MDENTQSHDDMAPANDPAQEHDRLTEDQAAVAPALNAAQLGVSPGMGIAGVVEEKDDVLKRSAS
jgi:hypothetical protein